MTDETIPPPPPAPENTAVFTATFTAAGSVGQGTGPDPATLPSADDADPVDPEPGRA